MKDAATSTLGVAATPQALGDDAALRAGARDGVGEGADGRSTRASEGNGAHSGTGNGGVHGPVSTRLKIGELARQTGKTVRALHLYEELGLLAPARSEGGFRLYGPAEAARVYWIGKLQDMGFKLQQIQGLLDGVASTTPAPAAMEGVRKVFATKLQQTRDHMRKLAQLECDLVEAIEYLDGCRTCTEQGPAGEACATCVHPRAARAPNLVAGIQLRHDAAASAPDRRDP